MTRPPPRLRLGRGGGGAAWGFVLVALVTPRLARAAPDRVAFERPACAPAAFDEDALERLLQVELAGAGVREVVITAAPDQGPASRAPATARLVLDGACADVGSVVARLGSSAVPGRITRWIPLVDVPRAARPRTIAIALAELVRASWPALAPVPSQVAPVRPAWPPPPASAPEPPVVPQAAVPEVRSRSEGQAPEPPRRSAGPQARPDHPPRWVLIALADARGFFPGGGVFFGGHAGARVPLPPFTVGGAIGAWRASSADPLGDVAVGLVSAAVNAGLGGRVGAVNLHAGPELEVGWVHAAGTAVSGAQGHTGDGVVVLAGLRGDLRFAAFGPVSGVLDAGFGAPLRGYVARADDRAALSVKNAAARAGLGLAVAF